MPIQTPLNPIAETILNCELSQDQSQDCEFNLNCELTQAKPLSSLTRKQRNSYLGKVHLLSTIHAELKDKINANRQALSNAFFRFEDDFIPETGESLVKLALDIENNCQVNDQVNCQVDNPLANHSSISIIEPYSLTSIAHRIVDTIKEFSESRLDNIIHE